MRNKTKLLLISALSLCTLSAGVTAIAASANEGQETTNQLELTFRGASIRYEQNKENGIRFAVQMSVEDWTEFSDSIEETWMVISYDGKDSTAVDTTKSWYTVDAEGKYAEADFVAYQTTVVMYDIPTENYATDFTVKGYAKMKETAEVVESPVKAEDARSMQDVAKEAVENDSTLAGALEAYLPSYTVSFDVDGGSDVNPNPMTAKYGTPVSALENIVPEKTGYTFAEWKVFNGEDYVSLPEDAVLTSDITVKAFYTANEYVLTCGETPVTVTYGAAIGELPAITVGEYEEAYWTLDGEKITEETVWNFTENKTAEKVVKNLLVYDFTDNVPEFSADNATWSKATVTWNGEWREGDTLKALFGSSMSYGIAGISLPVYASGHALTFAVGAGAMDLKIKLNETMLEVINAGGSLSMQVVCRNVVNDSAASSNVAQFGVGKEYKQVTDNFSGFGDWQKLSWNSAQVTANISDGYLTLKGYPGESNYLFIIDEITVVPDDSALTINFGEGMETVFENTTWSNGRVVSNGTVVNTTSNDYKGTSCTSRVGNVTAEACGNDGFVWVVGAGGGSVQFKIKLTDEMIAAYKAGGDISLKIKGMNAVSADDTASNVLHIGIGAAGSGYFQEVPDAYNDWGSEWTTITWLNSELTERAPITEDGYLVLRTYSNGNCAFYLIDEIAVTTVQA